MENDFLNLYRSLQELVGIYRQLLDAVRLENQALLEMDRKRLIEVTFTKEALIFSAQKAESSRILVANSFAQSLGISTAPDQPKLAKIIVALQGVDLKSADQLRSVFTTLTVLLQRIEEQNKSNRLLVDQGLVHLNRMRDQVIGAPKAQSKTYSASGKSVAPSENAARLVSREV